MIPPSQPAVQGLEVLANLYVFSGIAWGWVSRCLYWTVLRVC